LAPRELDLIFDEQFGVSPVSYHMRNLAKFGVVKKVRHRTVRGALQTFYVLSSTELPFPDPQRRHDHGR